MPQFMIDIDDGTYEGLRRLADQVDLDMATSAAAMVTAHVAEMDRRTPRGAFWGSMADGRGSTPGDLFRFACEAGIAAGADPALVTPVACAYDNGALLPEVSQKLADVGVITQDDVAFFLRALDRCGNTITSACAVLSRRLPPRG